mmetsp:Transcript_6862/g.15179  ORF Transcript_6862/g.15179 Transcript_6862/m.15179 type:complete len:121 (+) Transcript_6862:281-643(+)
MSTIPSTHHRMHATFSRPESDVQQLVSTHDDIERQVTHVAEQLSKVKHQLSLIRMDHEALLLRHMAVQLARKLALLVLAQPISAFDLTIMSLNHLHDMAVEESPEAVQRYEQHVLHAVSG